MRLLLSHFPFHERQLFHQEISGLQVLDQVGGLYTSFPHRFCILTITDFSKRFHSLLHLSIFFPPCCQAQICLSFCLLSRTECENVATTLVFCYKDEESTAWIKRLMCVWDKCQRKATHTAHRTQEDELWKRCLLFHFYSSCLLARSVLDRLYNLHRSFPRFI